MNKIITIGREFGSGGRELGRRVADELDYAYYDREIITMIAKRADVPVSYIDTFVERKPAMTIPVHVGQTFYGDVDYLQEQSLEVFKVQCEILKEVSERSNCVIVGRAADHILSEFYPLRIFVYADMDSKIKRCRENGVNVAKMSDKELRKQIQDIDEHRKAYYEFYTGKRWSDRLNYDVCVNSSGVSLEKLAKCIAILSDSLAVAKI